MKKAIGTIVGSLIFILIILAVFSSIFFITDQMFNLFSNQITKLSFESEKQSEKLEIISSAFDKYLPKRFLISAAASSSGNIFSLIKPLDDNYLTLTAIRTALIIPFDDNLTLTPIRPVLIKPLDDNYLTLTPIPVATYITNVTFNFEEIEPVDPMGEIRISIVFSYDILSSLTQDVYIFNVITNSWELVDTSSFTTDVLFSQKVITVTNLGYYILANLTVKVQIFASSTVFFKAYYDYISLKFEHNDPTKYAITYILNNSPFSSKIVSVVVFNSTTLQREELNITIPSSSLFLIKIKTYIINSNIKFITNLGNIFQSTISN